ncbi:MAG: hypothetical protein SGPRY_012623 [Prymnesium sp.]
MMLSVDGIDRFLPVSSVKLRAAEGAAADEGAVWRSMVFNTPGPLDGKMVIEHIYVDREEEQIRFVALEGSSYQEGVLEVVHAMHREPLAIEYFQRDRRTGERVDWDLPLGIVQHAIDATIELARAAEEHASATDNFGGKA